MSTSELLEPPLPPGYPERVAAAQTLVAHELAAAQGLRVCVTSSFQTEDLVVLDIVRRHLPEVPVIFLDTGYHFAEVYELRDSLAQSWSLNLVNLLPAETVAEQESRFGILHRSDPGRCCSLRKVGPLFTELEKYDVWFTGLRREQAKSRALLEPAEPFTLPSSRQLRKLSPLASWSTRDVWTFARQFGIPQLSLYARGYSSIGCEPCTSLPSDPNDPRSGRWAGRKQECGIHIQTS